MMTLNSKAFKEILGKELPKDISFQNLGWANTSIPQSLTFIDDEKYLKELFQNKNIVGVLTTETLSRLIGKEIPTIICDDPRWDFYTLFNFIAKANYKEFPSIISPTAQIHPTAFVSGFNVEIGDNTIIGPKVTILNDVVIGNNTIIRAGCVIGTEGFEFKRTSKGILPIFHDGKVIIGDKVDIGANCAVSKGFFHRNTIIEEDTKLDNLVHVAHGAQIGKRCLLPASCMIAGSTTIEDDVWIGPNSSISSQITIGKEAFITIGSVVTKSVKEKSKVTGNFAIPHHQFLRILKKNMNES